MVKRVVEKSNVARLLDRAGVCYELVGYDVDVSDLSAGHVASVLGEDVSVVFKTIVLSGVNTGLFVCVVPALCSIDLKKAARVSGNKRCELLALRELLPATGYVRGGCSPIGMRKRFATYLDVSAEGLDYVYVSGGRRGLQVRLSVCDLVRMTGAVFADLVVEGV